MDFMFVFNLNAFFWLKRKNTLNENFQLSQKSTEWFILFSLSCHDWSVLMNNWSAVHPLAVNICFNFIGTMLEENFNDDIYSALIMKYGVFV